MRSCVQTPENVTHWHLNGNGIVVAAMAELVVVATLFSVNREGADKRAI